MPEVFFSPLRRSILSPLTRKNPLAPRVCSIISQLFFLNVHLIYSQYLYPCRDMWNYLDVITLLMYLLIVILRIVTIARGGDPYHNRLLEVANYFYGANTMLLVLRFSSVLEHSAVVGPLQLALFRMLIDLLIILVQFFFVIIAFSLAITKSYLAEMSAYMTLPYNQTGDEAKYNA